jgi:transcriptional regulator GlxA family with amidase domain
LTHGNVKLRIVTIARECGIEMRTLERAFASSYRRTVTEYQRSVRLAFARWMLTISPPSKISAIAALLGYSRVQDFQRFFKKHMRQTPAEWGRMERERIAHAAQPPCE